MLIASIVLSLASLTPSLDPIGPCAPRNPSVEYNIKPLGDNDQICYLKYTATLAANKALYWQRIAECGGGSCECYDEAWDWFMTQMEDAELTLWWCTFSNA